MMHTTTTVIDSEWQFEPHNTWKRQTRKKRIKWQDVEALIGFPLHFWLSQEEYQNGLWIHKHSCAKIVLQCTIDQTFLSAGLDLDDVVGLNAQSNGCVLFDDKIASYICQHLSQKQNQNPVAIHAFLKTQLKIRFSRPQKWMQIAALLMFCLHNRIELKNQNQISFDLSNPLSFEDCCFYFHRQKGHGPSSIVQYTLRNEFQKNQHWQLQYQTLIFLFETRCYFQWEDVSAQDWKNIFLVPSFLSAIQNTALPKCLLDMVIEYLKPPVQYYE